MNLRFTEAARGVNKDVNINIVDTCPKCQGSRAELGTKAIRCTYCNGTGMETFSRGESINHLFTQKYIKEKSWLYTIKLGAIKL